MSSNSTVQYNKVQDQSVDYALSGIGVISYPLYDAGGQLWNFGEIYKGFTYIYRHQFTKAASFHLVYMDLKATGFNAPGSDHEMAAGVVWKF